MTAIKVIGAPLSPFVRKVHIALVLKGLEYEMDPVSPFNLPQGYEKINPLKRIPVLLHAGHYIQDSAIICRYLEDVFPEHPLVPADPLLKSRVAWFEKFADYELSGAISATAFRHRVVFRSLGREFDAAKIDAIIAARAPPLFDYLNAEIGDLQYLVGDTLTLADIAVVSQFINASMGGETVDSSRWPDLARYVDQHFAALPFAPLIEKQRGMVAKMLARAG